MSEVIWEDLEIDHSSMISDPEGFDKACQTKAEELRNIIRTGNSVTKFLSSLPDEEYDFTEVDKRLSDFWYWCEQNVPTTKLADVVSRMRKVSGQIEYIGNSRAQLALAEASKGMDKMLAFEQYKRLREVHSSWLKAMKLLKRYEGVAIPGMPGNFQSDSVLTHYIFLFEGDEDSMMNWHAVCKRIGSPPMNLMDTVDYIRNHPETNCTVTEVTK